MDILLTAGLGDSFSLESMMTEEERSSIETIYWATRTAEVNADLFRRSQRYAHVRHVILTTSDTIYFNIDGVRTDFPDLPEHVEDWSVMVRFTQWVERPFNLSTFLSEPPAEITEHKILKPDNYILIQHQTPANGMTERNHRDLTESEWRVIFRRLEAEDRIGVVVNSADADPPPSHPRIVNLVGQTTLPQSIALLRAADGFWGIASALSVLAAQIFPADKLLLKNPEMWCWLHRLIYFSPHETFPFLAKRLDLAEPKITKPMKQVKFNLHRLVSGVIVGPGSVMDLEESVARTYVDAGQATYFNATRRPPEKTATVAPPTRTATKKPPNRKASA